MEWAEAAFHDDDDDAGFDTAAHAERRAWFARFERNGWRAEVDESRRRRGTTTAADWAAWCR